MSGCTIKGLSRFLASGRLEVLPLIARNEGKRNREREIEGEGQGKNVKKNVWLVRSSRPEYSPSGLPT